MANGGSDNASVLLGNGDGSFQAARNFPAGTFPQSVAVGDFNGDGLQDLAVAIRPVFHRLDGVEERADLPAAEDTPESA